MKGARFTLTVVAALVGLALPSARADEKASKPSSPPSEEPSEDAPHPRAATVPEASPSKDLPQDATAALVRASAAYEYGDMNQVVESARPVAEGLLPATDEEQIQAFRLLGIGLYLTNRPLGAETAFTELLRKDPRARLDPTSTRPELVSFFESLRHKQIAHQRSTRKLYWNFIPPVGQFQNDDHIKGWIVLGVGVAAAATCATSFVLYKKWQHPDRTSTHPATAQTFRNLVNPISGGVLIATYLYGVLDGLIGYGKPLDESKPPVSLYLMPGGGGLGFTF
jgi:hypothetical protein